MKKLLCLCTIGFCDQASSWFSSLGWTEEFYNQQPSLVGDWNCVLGSAQLISHVLGAVHQKEKLSLQNKSNWVLGQGFNCRLVKGIGILLLVTTCCDDSGISGVVTLKSPGGVFAVLVFPIRKQITVLFIFPCILNLIDNLFVLPLVCMLIWLINKLR